MARTTVFERHHSMDRKRCRWLLLNPGSLLLSCLVDHLLRMVLKESDLHLILILPGKLLGLFDRFHFSLILTGEGGEKLEATMWRRMIDGCGLTGFQGGDASTLDRSIHDKLLQAFVDIMQGMDLPYPKFIDFALPGNRACAV